MVSTVTIYKTRTRTNNPEIDPRGNANDHFLLFGIEEYLEYGKF